MPPSDSMQHGRSDDCIAGNPGGTRAKRKAPVGTDAEMIRLRARPRPVHNRSGQPEAGSLNAILREHSGKRLYVRGIAWTGDQVRLLDMAFEKVDARIHECVTTTQTPQQDPRDLDNKLGESLDGEQRVQDECRWLEATRVTRMLLKENTRMQKLAMRTLLAAFGLVPSRGISNNGFRFRDMCGVLRAGELDFQFGGKAVYPLRPDGIFEMSSGEPQLVAYANFETISRFRKRHFWSSARKLRLVEPAKACEDPYIISILIGLAQHQRRLVRNGERCEGEGGQRATLIGVPTGKAMELYVYTTRIPDEFLAKLEKPSQRSGCGKVVVRYESISLTKPRKAACRLWLALRRNLPMLEQPQGIRYGLVDVDSS